MDVRFVPCFMWCFLTLLSLSETKPFTLIKTISLQTSPRPYLSLKNKPVLATKGSVFRNLSRKVSTLRDSSEEILLFPDDPLLKEASVFIDIYSGFSASSIDASRHFSEEEFLFPDDPRLVGTTTIANGLINKKALVESNTPVYTGRSVQENILLKGNVSVETSSPVPTEEPVKENILLKGDVSVDMSSPVPTEEPVEENILWKGNISLDKSSPVPTDESVQENILLKGNVSVDMSSTVPTYEPVQENIVLKGNVSVDMSSPVPTDKPVQEKTLLQMNNSEELNSSIKRNTMKDSTKTHNETLKNAIINCSEFHLVGKGQSSSANVTADRIITGELDSVRSHNKMTQPSKHVSDDSTLDSERDNLVDSLDVRGSRKISLSLNSKPEILNFKTDEAPIESAPQDGFRSIFIISYKTCPLGMKRNRRGKCRKISRHLVNPEAEQFEGLAVPRHNGTWTILRNKCIQNQLSQFKKH